MKLLVIGAHPDDNEFRCGGIAYKYKQLGHEVQFLTVCDGCRGHQSMTLEETRERRRREYMAVAEYLDIKYDCFEIEDCTVVADLETRRRMINYIRQANPDLVITHRTNDYHADHRAVAQLVQDAAYLLIVPHECPETPAMKKMPVIMFNVDDFTNPAFKADVVIDIDDVIEPKLKCADFHESQIYEWLRYEKGETAPEDKDERYEQICRGGITFDTKDKELGNFPFSYALRNAKVAARFRKELIATYGRKMGKKVRFAEAFMLSEYGTPLTEETKKILFPF